MMNEDESPEGIVNRRYIDLRKQFFSSFQANDIELTKRIIQEGKELELGAGLLKELCREGFKEDPVTIGMVQVLLENGADINTRFGQDTLFMFACRLNRSKMVETLLRFNPDLTLGFRADMGVSGLVVELTTAIDIVMNQPEVEKSSTILELILRSPAYNSVEMREAQICKMNERRFQPHSSFEAVRTKIARAVDILLEDRPGYPPVDCKKIMENHRLLHDSVKEQLEKKLPVMKVDVPSDAPAVFPPAPRDTSPAKSSQRFFGARQNLNEKAELFLKAQIKRLRKYSNAGDKINAMEGLLTVLAEKSIGSLDELCRIEEPTSQKNFLQILQMHRVPGETKKTTAYSRFRWKFHLSKKLGEEVLKSTPAENLFPR